MGRPKSQPTLFEIWQANGRIASIENPVRLKILRHLEGAPRTLNELVVATRKSKPTLSSLHIPPLLETGLVQEQHDPRDGRIKWYRLVGNRLGSSVVDPAQLRDAVLGFVERKGFIPLRPLLDVIRPAELVAKTPGYADAVATRLGELLGKMLLTKDRAESTKELSRLLENLGLGTVAWTGTDARVEATDPKLKTFLTTTVDAALGAHERELTA